MSDPQVQPDGPEQAASPSGNPVPPPPPAGYQAPPPGYGQQVPPQGYPQQGYPPQGGQPGYQPQPAGAPLSQAEDKQWAMFSHFGGIIGPLPALIIFLVFKDRGPYVRQESKEALNWQITFTATMIILGILSGIITGIMISSLSFGAFAFVSGLFTFLYVAVWVLNVIFSIMGGMKVNNNGAYRYPFAIRLIK